MSENNSAAAEKTIDKNVKTVIDQVLSSTVFGSAKGDEITYDNFELKVQAVAKEPEQNGQMYMVDIGFLVSHPFFDEPIVENVVGIGHTPDEALATGASSFVDGTLEAIFRSLECKGENGTTIETKLMGKRHVFRKPATHQSQYAGCENTNMQDLWKLIYDIVPMYLGTKKAYWIKLFTACSNNTPTCEITINGIEYRQLTQRLFKYVKTWSDRINFHSEKQFFLLIQDDETYTECDITKERVVDLTLKSIALLKQIEDDDTRTKAVNTIKMLAKDNNLALEMCTFLPEIYTQKVLDIDESDALMAVKGEEKIPLMKSQLRTYGYIEDTVKKYLFFEKPSNEDNLKIMCLSTKMQAVHKAVSDGLKLEDIVLPPTCFFVNEDYEVK